MAGPLLFDRVRETSVTTGSGNFTTSGTVVSGGFRRFQDVLSSADTCYYTIQNPSANEWEVGLGTFTSPVTLARTTILSSSNGGSVVTFSAGTKDVWIDIPAQAIISLANANTWTATQAVELDGLATSPTPGLTLINATAATSGATLQYPPSIVMSGASWSGSASVQEDCRLAFDTGDLMFQFQSAGGGFGTHCSIRNDGLLSCGAISATGDSIFTGTTTTGKTDAATTTSTTVSTFVHQSGGTPATGFGLTQLVELADATNGLANAFDITSTWVVATHSSTTSRTVFNVYDTAAREAIRLQASGSAPMISFLGGVSAAIRQTGDAGTALVTFGLMSGTPTFAVANLTGTTVPSSVVISSLTQVGTIAIGVWQGTVVGSTYGGTGVNNAGRTLTIAANSGTISFTSSVTLTVAATASVSGTNTGDQTITLTGAVTGSGTGSFATTIATPGTLTVATTNSTATAHTHAITSSSAPGTAASLLATDSSGIIGSTGTRIVKGWFTDLTVTNAIAGSITGNAATVTTNANLTGPVTSSGNATAVANNAITNAMAAQMAGSTIKGNNTGSTANAADLTVAQVNTLLGTAVKISAATGGGVASYDFTSLTGYSSFLFVYDELVPVTNAVDFWIRCSTNNGSTWDSGAHYNFAWTYATPTPTNGAYGLTGANQIVPMTSINNASNGAISGFCYFYPGTGFSKLVGQLMAYQSGSNFSTSAWAATYSQASPNGVRFMFASGNISSGTITLYGLP